MKIELRFLGAVEALADGRPVTAALDRKEMALLAFLAAEGRQVLRDKVRPLFWGETAEEKAQNSLRQALLNIKDQLGEVVIRHGRLALSLRESVLQHTDVWQFEEHIRRGELEQAVALYKGRFLDSLALSKAGVSEEWLGERQRYYERLAMDCLHSLMAEAEQRRDNTALANHARRAIAIDPFEEEVYRQLMLALGRAGRFGEALQVYAQCVRTLRAELDVPPAAETAAVYERVLLARATSRRDLPFHAATFVGREQELAEAAALLLRPDCRLLTFLGPGGVGKTRLAIELARRNRSLFLHDVCYVALESRSANVSRESLLDALAGALGLPTTTNRLLEDVIDHLRPRETLIILDNFEPFVPVASLLTDIVRHTPDVKLLVTSRELMNVVDETVYRVGGLAYPLEEGQPLHPWRETPLLPDGDASGSDPYDAIAFFVRVAGRLNAGFNPAANRDDVIRICRLVEGLPLALEMIAPWTLTMSSAAIAGRIAADMSNLIAYERNFPERHRSLNAVFEHSWNLLAPEEQAAFRRLAVIVGHFSLPAAEAIAGATRTMLQRLARQSMLDKPDKEHYTLHPLLRAFALHKLREANEVEAIETRHFAYFSRFVESRLPALRGVDQLLVQRQMAEEFGNIRAAWRHGVKHAAAGPLIPLMDGTYRFCQDRGWYAAGIEIATLGKEELARRPMSGLAGRLMLNEGLMHYYLGNYEQTAQRAADGLLLCEQEADERGIAQALFLRGMTYHNTNHYAEARVLLTDSLNIYLRLGLWEEAAECHIMLGNGAALVIHFSPQGKPPYKPPRPFFHEHYPLLAHHQESVRTALTHFGEAARLYRKTNSVYGEAVCFASFAYARYLLHEYERAADEYREAALLFQRLNSTSNLTQCLNWWAWLLHMQGNVAEARLRFHEALHLGLANLAYKRLLDCLQKYSLFLWVSDKEHFTPLAINAFVAAHPNTDGRMVIVAREWMQNISDFMREDEGQEAVEKALAFGRSQTLASLVHYLVPDT